MANAEQHMDREDIKARVRAIIQEQLENDEVVYDKDNLDSLRRVGVDSLSFVEVIFQIEEEFGLNSGVGVTDEQLYEIATTDDLADLILAAKIAG